MFIYAPEDHNGLAVVTDFRGRDDALIDKNMPGVHVHEVSGLGKFMHAALGKEWKRTTRIALFDHKQRPTSKRRAEERLALSQYLFMHLHLRVVLVCPTPNQRKQADNEAEARCHSWQALKMPDSMDAMMFTYHAVNYNDPYVVALPRLDYRTKEVTRWAMAQTVARALMVAMFADDVDVPPFPLIRPNAAMVSALHSMRRKPIAIDIETMEGSNKILAVGVSDGVTAVSMPWDAYTPAGSATPEKRIGKLTCGPEVASQLRDLLASPYTSKFFHNYTFDVPRMRASGFEINGPIEDTFAAHAIAFPELKHGLQVAAASMLTIPPWKSTWHPKDTAYTKEDIEYWTCNPQELRYYNARDAYYTMKLAEKIMPCVNKTYALRVPPLMAAS